MRGHLVLHFDLAREFAKAIEAAKTTLDIDPSNPDGWNYGLVAYESTGRFDEAIDARAHLAQSPERLTALRAGLAADGARGYWSALRDHELTKAKNGQASARTLSAASARLGQDGEAIDWLARRNDEARHSCPVLEAARDNFRDSPIECGCGRTSA